MVKKVVIDCAKLTERRQAHRHLAEMFEFPEYYGKNLDALFDCLTELGECYVELDGADSLRESGGYGAKILNVIDAAVRANPLIKLEICGSEAAEPQIPDIISGDPDE